MDYDRIETAGPRAEEQNVEQLPRRSQNYLLHIGLFLLTFISVTFSGLQFVWTGAIDSYGDLFANFHRGLPFGILIMLFITAHEFGHYIAARIHKVDVTLPFYIPMPFFLFGTMGAVIRLRSEVPSRKAMFDIGVAGPLAGFAVALIYLVIGMIAAPTLDAIYAIHPEYRNMTSFPQTGMHFGSFLLFDLLKGIFIPSGGFFPGMNEIYHFPFLAAGWFGMIVTALNLIPVGQLDGGHVVYAMFGRKQEVIGRWFVRFLVFAGLGSIGMLLLDAVRSYNPDGFYQFLQKIFGPPMEWIAANASWWLTGWMGWLLWAALIKIFFKVPHPPISDETPLDSRRMAIGWIAIIILVLTFTFSGLYEPSIGM